jgi:5'(3')-deoxyribonucleotidase
MTIFFDMDDVGNELNRFLCERYNEDFNDNFDWRKSRDFFISKNPEIKADADYFSKLLHEEGAFFNLKPSPGYPEIMKKLIDEGYKVRILTYPQWDSPYCLNEKVKWIQTYLPFFDLNHIFMAKNKGEVSKPGRILLDDSPHNLKAWEKEGGIGVAYAKINYAKKWDGLKVENFDEFYKLVHELKGA